MGRGLQALAEGDGRWKEEGRVAGVADRHSNKPSEEDDGGGGGGNGGQSDGDGAMGRILRCISAAANARSGSAAGGEANRRQALTHFLAAAVWRWSCTARWDSLERMKLAQEGEPVQRGHATCKNCCCTFSSFRFYFSISNGEEGKPKVRASSGVGCATPAWQSTVWSTVQHTFTASICASRWALSVGTGTPTYTDSLKKGGVSRSA